MDINFNQKSQIPPFIVGSEENKMIRQAENINVVEISSLFAK